jgi:hypothetical protein
MAVYAEPHELVLTPDVAVRAAIEVDDAPGTPAAIERLIGAALADGSRT